MNVRSIARIAHQVNKAYCESLNDSSQVDWEEAPDWQQRSAMEGVLAIQENPELTPRESHEQWLKYKQDSGWKYGTLKDPAKLEHPCIMPYDELPIEQRAKDYIFQGVVKALTGDN